MESLVDLRDSARIFLRGSSHHLIVPLDPEHRFPLDLEPRLDNDGRFILTAETRETVHELRSELSKSRSAVSQEQVASTTVSQPSRLQTCSAISYIPWVLS